MKIKKAKLKLELVSENLEKYKSQAFFGVSSNAPEILAIWGDYNDLRLVLTEHNPELYGELSEVNPPDPEAASSFSLVDVGEPIYHPKHFSTIENEIRKAEKFVQLEEEEKPVVQKMPGKISISAQDGSNVTVQIGSDNRALQNVEKIDNTLKEIGELGIDEEDLINLKQILSQDIDKTETKTGIGKRIMNWSRKMARKLVEKGLTDNISVLMEKAGSLIDLI